MEKVHLAYGLLAVTTSYAAVCLSLLFSLSIDCLEEPCNSEGVDNSIVGWATAFWTALCMFLFGAHLQWFVQQSVYTSGILAQWSMAMAFVSGGVAHSIFPNSGMDDNVGQLGFYIAQTLGFSFMTLSAYQVYRFTIQVTENYCPKTLQESSSCFPLSLKIPMGLVVLAWAATSGGYIWCAIESDLHVTDAVDEIEPIEQDQWISGDHQCLNLANIAQISWFCSYSLLWIPVGILLRRTISQSGEVTGVDQTRLVYGFSNAWACIGMIVLPWTIGAMWVVWSGITTLILDLPDSQATYNSIVYHYGMLLSYFLFHNIAYSLPRHELRTSFETPLAQESKLDEDDNEKVENLGDNKEAQTTVDEKKDDETTDKTEIPRAYKHTDWVF